MIIKKYNQLEYIWDPLAFNGKGYWFLLAPSGSIARAATKKEYNHLGKPSNLQLKTKSDQYQHAIEISGIKLSDLITNRINDMNVGVFSAISGGISDKVKAKFTNIKKTFDPLNIISKLTGKSRLATSIGARILGRSKEDVDFFTNRKNKTVEKIENTKRKLILKLDGSLTKRFTDIYNILSKHFADKQKQFFSEIKEIPINSKEKDLKNKKLIKALTGKDKLFNGIDTEKPKVEEKKKFNFLDAIGIGAATIFIGKEFVDNELGKVIKKIPLEDLKTTELMKLIDDIGAAIKSKAEALEKKFGFDVSSIKSETGEVAKDAPKPDVGTKKPESGIAKADETNTKKPEIIPVKNKNVSAPMELKPAIESAKPKAPTSQIESKPNLPKSISEKQQNPEYPKITPKPKADSVQERSPTVSKIRPKVVSSMAKSVEPQKVKPSLTGSPQERIASYLFKLGWPKKAIANVLGEIQAESGFKLRAENTNYRPETLVRVFGSKFKSVEQAKEVLSKGKVYLMDYLYGPPGIYGPGTGNRGGLGNTQIGDGYKFRGRGYIQITGRKAYESLGKIMGVDLVSNPDLLNDPKYAIEAIPAFFKWKGKTPDQLTNIETVTRTIAPANFKNELIKRTKYANNFGHQLNEKGSVLASAVDNFHNNVGIVNNTIVAQNTTKTNVIVPKQNDTSPILKGIG